MFRFLCIFHFSVKNYFHKLYLIVEIDPLRIFYCKILRYLVMRTILSIVLYVMAASVAKAQCIPSEGLPAMPDCSSATLLTNGANITSGSTFSDHGGTSGTFTGVQVNGGTLVLCGTTNLVNISFNSGVIRVNAGANVTFSSTVPGAALNGSGDAFYNFGTSTFGSVTIPLEVFCNRNGIVYNNAGASIVVHGNVILNQGTFDNNGSIAVDSVTINSLQSTNSVCLGPSSTTNISRILNNDATAPVSISGAGNACISLSGVYQGTGTLTSSANVIICVLPGTTAPTPAQAGSATIMDPCTGCSVVLPIRLLYFRGHQNGDQVELQWATALEENEKYFVVERSVDSRNFTAIDTIMIRNQPSSYTYSTRITTDCNFRLKIIDMDGDAIYSSVLRMQAPTANPPLSIISSNPSVQSYLRLSVYSPENTRGELNVIDNIGRNLKKIHVSLPKGTTELKVDLNGIGTGLYYIRYFSPSGKPQIIPFINIRP